MRKYLSLSMTVLVWKWRQEGASYGKYCDLSSRIEGFFVGFPVLVAKEFNYFRWLRQWRLSERSWCCRWLYLLSIVVIFAFMIYYSLFMDSGSIARQGCTIPPATLKELDQPDVELCTHWPSLDDVAWQDHNMKDVCSSIQMIPAEIIGIGKSSPI